ncbi:hypothetical protein CYY_001813 [Polysphondylium violaceum]|uniref:phosphopyruvate hydratase n=1 Tax=Polysphondylium violaceum TaxID=133409 RepID=A0A8J4Q0H5_9MYCE|nr:hypothetical protein CYY_001813 [Polysphondylium violaceum]
MSIINISAIEILDSRGNPTIEVELDTTDGCYKAAVPSGASTGIHEAYELRDGDKSRYGGKGVLKAIDNIHRFIAPALKGRSVSDQAAIDKIMITLDGTANKSKLGANAILGVSMAICRAGAEYRKEPLYKYIAELAGNHDNIRLPVPSFNIINGGVHAGNPLPIQEFMIFPLGAPTYSDALRYGAETYHCLKDVIKEKYGLEATNVGDEGGFAPPINTPQEALDLIVCAIDRAGHTGKVKIGIDSAASEFYDKSSNRYDFGFKTPDKGKRLMDGQELGNLYTALAKEYPIVFFEDPFDENDWDSFSKFTAKENIQIIGDDLLCTNVERIKEAQQKKACNSLLLKINQIGTITEALEAANLAKKGGWACLVSHRSGEVEDSFIADLVVGIGAGQIKSGAPCRTERTIKYNQLLRIEKELNQRTEKAIFTGNKFNKF